MRQDWNSRLVELYIEGLGLSSIYIAAPLEGCPVRMTMSAKLQGERMPSVGPVDYLVMQQLWFADAAISKAVLDIASEALRQQQIKPTWFNVGVDAAAHTIRATAKHRRAGIIDQEQMQRYGCEVVARVELEVQRIRGTADWKTWKTDHRSNHSDISFGRYLFERRCTIIKSMAVNLRPRLQKMLLQTSPEKSSA